MSIRKTLTEFSVRNAKPQTKPYEVSDGGQRGLRLVVHPSGSKGWIVRYRHPVTGKSRKLTLQPGLSIAQARVMTSDAMFQVAQGIDPIDQRREQKVAAVAATEGTLNFVVEQYLAIRASKLRSSDHYKSVLKRHVLPRLGEHQVTELKRSEITAVLDKVEIDSGPCAADQALAVLSAALSWHESRADGWVSPLVRAKGMRRTKASERARDRLLSDDEIKRVWEASGDERMGTYGATIRFMILTGSRKNEAAGLRRSEIGLDDESGITVWKLPKARSKNKQEVTRPLSAAALAIIESMPQIGDSDFVFTLDGNRALNMNYQTRRDLLDEISRVQGWVLHDLRRVYRSLLSRCRVPFEVSERLLGHTQPLIAQIYDKHSHVPAMLEVVEKVAGEIARIVSGERGGKVIKLRS
jgi:integrase